ncbi:Murein L,D-transpeptidase YcbB/YkuD [Monaibacterium marinum]|uniref:Murein L,D-transpeptidase YcbB/YkuD n=1 Tax=Pontivivens marinum TaxID=1690039 RepID=A0A2C9CWR8_9RHOB|nr:L,D-transpeptidase family protein [Monaibacterium marinum]SOH95555.1 Murein L,D-transpeptidase YcbB/YkuD [Monaibacterium marinum]
MYQFSNSAIFGAVSLLALTAGSGAIAQVSVDSNVETPIAVAMPIWSELADIVQIDASMEVASFYADRNYAPLFMANDAEVARAVIDALASQHLHALPEWGDRLEPLSRHVAAAVDGYPTAEGEVAFAEAYIALAQARLTGVVVPTRLSDDMYVFPPEISAATALDALAEQAAPVRYLMDLAPDHPDYAPLLALRAELEQVVANGGWGAADVPSGASIRAGERDERVPAIRARLLALGDIEGPRAQRVMPVVTPVATTQPLDDTPLDATSVSNAVQPDPTYMDDATVAALMAFQTRHGLNDDGVIGPKTLAALNTTADERLRQVLVNLERVRWTDWDRNEKHIYVNLADYRMWLRENGEELFTTRTVIGSSRHQTVEFSDTMTHLVVNPTWTVPRSIATEEILPALRDNPNYLNERNMTLIDDGTGVWTPSDTSLINWANFSESFFPWWIRQGPGPGNSLGNVKFMFPNQFAIYLHDTPSRSLFARDARAFSHGCVRVADPTGLAEVLLQPQSSDPLGLFQRHRATGRETTVNLQERPAVHIDYRTVWIDESGQVQYRDDVYGRDALVLNAMQDLGVQTGQPQG